MKILRKLELKDAPLMYEWMHDEMIVKNLQTDFMKKTIKDCEDFINLSLTDHTNLHFAIVDEEDVYMGTVSLKNINHHTAEFGIAVRKSAMGKGYAIKAMKEIIQYGFTELQLHTVFWCVSPWNKRALRFYDKNGYQRIDMRNKKVEGYTNEQVNQYIWYAVE